MIPIRKLLGAAALTIVAALCAPRAEAQVLVAPAIDYRTEGGRVLYNCRVQIFTSGLTVAELTDPRQPGQAILLTDQVRPSVVLDLVNGLYRAKFHSLAPVVRSRAPIMDAPDQIVRFGRKIVRYTTMGQPRDPVAPDLYIAALDALAAHFARIADEPLVRYELENGRTGLTQELTITRGGRARVASRIPGDRPYLKEEVADFGRLNALKGALTLVRWFSLPDYIGVYPRPPVAGDLYEIAVHDLRDRPKAVGSNSDANPPRNFLGVKHILDAIVADVRQ